MSYIAAVHSVCGKAVLVYSRRSYFFYVNLRVYQNYMYICIYKNTKAMKKTTRRELILQANDADTRSQLAAFLNKMRQIIKDKALPQTDIEWVLDEAQKVKRVIS